MGVSNTKRNVILSILFFLPVAFIIIMLTSNENYNPLDVVKENIVELPVTKDSIQLKNHITVLSFLGKQPMDNSIVALNLKELIYDRCKGFKTFQVVVMLPHQAKEQAEKLLKEIKSYEDLRFWHFVYADEFQIKNVFKSLKSDVTLNENLATNSVYIIDKELNQRGRLDNRTDDEKVNKKPVYGLYDYDCISIDELKNKMSGEDMRILFTEYRDKRVGKFEGSTTRRGKDLKQIDE